METKEVSFYSSAAGGGVADPGLFTGVGIQVQNMSISSNLTDIKRMLPYLDLGTGKFQRIGDSVRPVSLTTRITLSLSAAQMSVLFPSTAYTVGSGAYDAGGQHGWPINDVTAVVFALTHKSYKDYQSLNATNVFSELLDDGQGNTTGFGAQTAPFVAYPWHGQMKINDAKYTLIKKFKVDLRKEMFVGSATPGLPPAPSNIVLNTNSHKYATELTVKLTDKHLPAVLKYDTSTQSASSFDPTNFAPFFVVGCYNKSGTVTTYTPLSVFWTSTLRYKDA